MATSRRDTLPDEQQPNVRWVRLEVTDQGSIDDAVQEAANAFGRIDVLVNNAGYCLMGPLEANSMQQIRAQFGTNVFGLVAVTQAALPQLKATKGGIVNIASVAVENGYPFNSVYSATKAAVMNLTETQSYFRGERWEALWFVVPLGLAFAFYGGVALRAESGGFAWGAAVPVPWFAGSMTHNRSCRSVASPNGEVNSAVCRPTFGKGAASPSRRSQG